MALHEIHLLTLTHPYIWLTPLSQSACAYPSQVQDMRQTESLAQPFDRKKRCRRRYVYSFVDAQSQC